MTTTPPSAPSSLPPSPDRAPRRGTLEALFGWARGAPKKDDGANPFVDAALRSKGGDSRVADAGTPSAVVGSPPKTPGSPGSPDSAGIGAALRVTELVGKLRFAAKMGAAEDRRASASSTGSNSPADSPPLPAPPNFDRTGSRSESPADAHGADASALLGDPELWKTLPKPPPPTLPRQAGQFDAIGIFIDAGTPERTPPSSDASSANPSQASSPAFSNPPTLPRKDSLSATAGRSSPDDSAVTPAHIGEPALPPILPRKDSMSHLLGTLSQVSISGLDPSAPLPPLESLPRPRSPLRVDTGRAQQDSQKTLDAAAVLREKGDTTALREKSVSNGSISSISSASSAASRKPPTVSPPVRSPPSRSASASPRPGFSPPMMPASMPLSKLPHLVERSMGTPSSPNPSGSPIRPPVRRYQTTDRHPEHLFTDPGPSSAASTPRDALSDEEQDLLERRFVARNYADLPPSQPSEPTAGAHQRHGSLGRGARSSSFASLHPPSSALSPPHPLNRSVSVGGPPRPGHRKALSASNVAFDSRPAEDDGLLHGRGDGERTDGTVRRRAARRSVSAQPEGKEEGAEGGINMLLRSPGADDLLGAYYGELDDPNTDDEEM
ncbi:hypothetical protein DFJ74DRAFT_679876 [Hyaloraphidium curvatum]|nr:hypothetical protein DFJ74DRAFT_679876 [Hyaloraphidium curvatum]